MDGLCHIRINLKVKMCTQFMRGLLSARSMWACDRGMKCVTENKNNKQFKISSPNKYGEQKQKYYDKFAT